jgi:hypothetical protein
MKNKPQDKRTTPAAENPAGADVAERAKPYDEVAQPSDDLKRENKDRKKGETHPR